jgi:hypothetical protein
MSTLAAKEVRICCESLRTALAWHRSSYAPTLSAISGYSVGQPAVFLSSDNGETTLCTIEYCPWCGAGIRFEP